MKVKLLVLLISLFPLSSSFSQFFKILESDNNHLKISINFDKNYTIKQKTMGVKNLHYIEGGLSFKKRGEPWLPSEDLKIGIPFSSNPKISITDLRQEKTSNIYIAPSPDSLNQPFDDLFFDPAVYQSDNLFPRTPVDANYFIMRYLRVASIELSPYQYNPVSRELVFNKSFIISINFNMTDKNDDLFTTVEDEITEEFAESMVNASQSKSFIAKQLTQTPDRMLNNDSLWYSPLKDFYKVYLVQKGLYRITYEKLISSGVPANNGLQDGKLELFNMGKKVPLEITDKNNNGTFDEGDYFQFIGVPAPPADSFTYLNIYNNSNVYWFSYQADSVFKYKSINGFPIDLTLSDIAYTQETYHFEKDLKRETLGYAPDDKRDFWLWESAEARNYQEYKIFLDMILDTMIIYRIKDDLPLVTLRAGIQGITNTNCNGNGHSANIKFNGRIMSNKKWDGQQSVIMETTFPVDYNYTTGEVPLFRENKFEIALDGNVCENTGSDLVMVNWYEFSYWRWNRVVGKAYNFKNPPNKIGKNQYYMYRWLSDTMKIFIPQRGECILNARVNHDGAQSVQFQDSISEMTEYFCYDYDEDFLIPDSIKKDISISDLGNTNQGVDYLIITHPLFTSVAEKLKNYRSSHLTDYENPRVKIVDIFDIYDEFSFGLLNPEAVQKFIKYVFDKWESPTIAYVSLLGDMTFYYRTSINWIPSMPYQAIDYGQAPSDNIFVAVSGNDLTPDIAIGRISCETVEQGNVLVDKIINYPADNGKDWKQNVLLLASGMDALDEMTFGFNDNSEILDNKFLKPNGIHASKVYRFPNKPEYFLFQGAGPKIREEFNKGAVLANYYGHGGGGQWDLTFLNDDIFQLQNQNRLPFVLSVTCYTAHFADQTIFGEVFNRVPGKGSIAFYGSSGLTWWQAGTYFNDLLFDQIFNKKNYTIGKAILNSKASGNLNAYYLSQVTLLHLLGDPAIELALPKKPDFAINTANISYKPINPLKDDTVDIKIKIRNLGIDFKDSVTVALYHTRIDTSSLIGIKKVGHFGEIDSLNFKWIINKPGLYNLITEVNLDNLIPEDDHSDNKAISQLVAFDFSEPNIVKPLNGAQYNNKVNFVLVDVGDYIEREFKYQIQIDTTKIMNSSSLISSPVISAINGVVKWSSPILNKDEYFWRALIFDNIDTNKSKIFTFSISNNTENPTYIVQNNQLKYLENYNMIYDESEHSLKMYTELLSPRPQEGQLLDTMRISLPDTSSALTCFTTDGSYLYFSHLPHYLKNAPTKIYKVGSGLNGTEKGKVEGPLPNSIYFSNSMFYYTDGFLYAATKNRTSLLQINKQNGDTLSIALGDSLLPSLDGLIQDSSSFYLSSDGNMVYNLSAGYGDYRNKYILRTFDPKNSWNKVGQDKVFDGESHFGFSGFYIVNGKLFTYESKWSGFMRRYDLATKVFEEEFLVLKGMVLYTLSFDWINNLTWGTTFKPGGSIYTPALYKFKGTYKDTKSYVYSDDIGPSYKWNKVNYNVDTLNFAGQFSANLIGLNKSSGNWDTLKQNISSSTQIDNVDTKVYEYLKVAFNFVDISSGQTEPIKLNSLSAEFTGFPEISLHKRDIIFTPDTLMQGFSTEISVKVVNVGESTADSIILKYTSNDSDSAFIVNKVTILPDSSVIIKNTINTSTWAPATLYDTRVFAETPFNEKYTFNNLSQKTFFVSRDSLAPEFRITFDGKEINNGDIVSAKPKIVITLKDNSPLALDTTMFTLVFNNIPMGFSKPDIKFSYTPYPNSEARIDWQPTKLLDGKNVLEILAKDSSGNFFDTVTHKVEFFVYNTTDLKNVFNFPNPFKNDTYFTFELLGQSVPQEFTIKIFTVAGRLIRSITVPSENLKVGFNKVYWDGKDQDLDEVANGLYFYKIVSRNNGIIKTAIQKLAKVK